MGVIATAKDSSGMKTGRRLPLRCLNDHFSEPLVPLHHKNVSSTEEIVLYQVAEDLDDVCRTLMLCPSMQALTRYFNDVTRIPLTLFVPDEEEKNDPENPPPLGLYMRHKKEVWLRYHEQKENEKKWYPPIAAHEFRHGWQDSRGILIKQDLRIFDRMALVRAYEADAVVMQTTIAAEQREYCGDQSAFNALLSIERSAHTTEAFDRAMRDDPDALWNGRAQQATFMAYLQESNLKSLSRYDILNCEFAEAALQEEQVQQYRGQDAFYGAIGKLFYMPWFSPVQKRFVERPHYTALRGIITQDILLECMREDIHARALQIELTQG